MKTDAHPQYDLERIYAISIVEVARRLGLNVRRSGVNYVTNCPWHDDANPSLVLYRRTGENHCHCFVCGHDHKVIRLTMQVLNTDFLEACKWLSAEFCIPTLDGRTIHQAKRRLIQKPLTEEEQPDYMYIPTEMADRMVTAEDGLTRCLMHLFNPEAVKWMVEEYRVGCYAFGGLDDYTTFPSIDSQGRVTNIKIQHYDSNPESPTFCHCDKTPYMLGKIWQNDGLLPRDAALKPACMFGEHLLSKYPTQTVVLVESPKNAIVGSLACPEMLWIAAGNKTGIRRERMMPLAGRNVIVMPDRDAIGQWTKDVAELSDLANFTVRPFSLHTGGADDKHFDVADFVIGERWTEIGKAFLAYFLGILSVFSGCFSGVSESCE